MKVKRTIAIVLLIILITIFGFLSSIFLKNLREKNERDLISEIHSMGNNLYSNYYYKIVSVDKTKEQLDEFLSKFEVMGLTFSLDELEKYSDDYKNTVNEYMKINKSCKKSQIMVVIHPKKPYRESDFESEIRDECVRTQ